MFQDLRYGALALMKRPGFTFVSVLTLALGIGANTAIFSVVNAYLFKPLPVSEPDRLVVLASKDQRSEAPHGTSYLNYADIRNQRDVFTDVIAYVPDIVSLNVDGEAERSMIELVSGNYFSMLGVEAAQGRVFTPDEGQTVGSSPVMVLSYGYWQRRYRHRRGAGKLSRHGADPDSQCLRALDDEGAIASEPAGHVYAERP